MKLISMRMFTDQFHNSEKQINSFSTSCIKLNAGIQSYKILKVYFYQKWEKAYLFW